MPRERLLAIALALSAHSGQVVAGKPWCQHPALSRTADDAAEVTSRRPPPTTPDSAHPLGWESVTAVQ